MPSNTTADKEMRDQKGNASTVAGSKGVSFQPPAQLKNDSTKDAGLLNEYQHAGQPDVAPFKPSSVSNGAGAVQRLPANAPPGGDGMEWDTFNTKDHNGTDVPGEVIGVMRNPDDGGVPSADPPGWDWLKTKYGKLKGQWVRFHIINATLGGPGDDIENLVPTTHATNHNAGWRNLEDAAKATALEDDEEDSSWTYVEVDLDYDNAFPDGIPETITAERGIHDGTNWVKQGASVNLVQGNPDDGNNNNYLPGTQITKAILRNTHGLSVAQANAIKDLIDDTWDDQDELEEAIQDAENNVMADDNWYNILNRMYVAEDDGDGPYPVVFKVT